MNFKPVALEIMVNNKKKTVGKCVVLEPNPIVPNLRGRFVLYREVLWRDLVSFKLSCIGIDAAAFDYAKEHGIEGMVCYSKDRKILLTVSTQNIEQCHVIALKGSEGSQYRIPLSMCKRYDNVTDSICKQWITETVLLEPKKGWPDSAEQKSLFD